MAQQPDRDKGRGDEANDGPTVERPDPLGRLPRVALREAPELRWTDARGEHAARVESRAVIGSAAGVDIVVADRQVSRLHAELELRDDGLWVRDSGSTNGTYVDGVRVREAQVPTHPGRIQVGATVITVHLGATPAEVALWPNARFGPLLGRSAAMRELFARLARFAATDSPVLVQGETGTGKELVAQAIHDSSARRAAPFVVVDCAGLPDALLESELFGHARGAFTGAQQAREGAIESAAGGTVFLDEIGELPLAMQPKLLRVLEARTVRRLGETQHRKVDVRFVSATHRDLRAMVNAGTFREDLYFRLAVLPVTVPPLRAHAEDVPLLAEHFAARAGADADGAAALGAELHRELAARAWSGNVRELRNFVERAVAVGPRAALELDAPSAAATTVGTGGPPDEAFARPLPEARERWTEWFEREYLRRLMERHAGDVPAAAREAGVDRTYLYRLMRRHRG